MWPTRERERARERERQTSAGEAKLPSDKELLYAIGALLGSRATAFSLDSLLDEVSVLLTSEPEWYAYCAPQLADTLTAVSPSAV